MTNWMLKNLRIALLFACLAHGTPGYVAMGQSAVASVAPVPLDPNITIRRFTTAERDAIRLGYLPSQNALYYVRISGDIWRVDLATGEKQRVARATDHGLGGIWGFELTPEGRFYLVSNDETGIETQATIKRGILEGNETIPSTWDILAQTERYPEAGDIFDHVFNAIKESHDGRWIYVNSGSRTDHGEIQDNMGRFPGLREIPITSAILKLPADTTDLLLLNDEDFLVSNGFVWADGVRNTFDLEYGPEGRLFGVENSGDRDDSEEMNWIREGRHYGYPWRIGTTDTPQQFPDYDPSQDPFVGPGASAPFDNDPTYPPPPDGVVFTDPIASVGPDADKFRDPADGAILDASDEGVEIGTFTAHRSPLGLTFDNAGALAEPYTGDGFVLSWTSGNSSLLGPMQDAGEDLLHIVLEYLDEEETYEATVTRVVRGFVLPMDAILVGNKMYVLEMRWSCPGSNRSCADVWELTFPPSGSTASERPELRGDELELAVFPNPFAGASKVTFTLKEADRVRIDLVDVTGRLVATIHDRFESIGTHEATVPELTPGLYLVRVQTSRTVSSTVIAAVK
jgi:glucose/arabinose dehydrogenase